MVIGNLPSGSSLMSQLALKVFHCVMDYDYSLFNYPLGIIHIGFATTYASIIALVTETISFN